MKALDDAVEASFETWFSEPGDPGDAQEIPELWREATRAGVRAFLTGVVEDDAALELLAAEPAQRSFIAGRLVKLGLEAERG